MGVITYNGVRSDLFGLVVETPPNRMIPRKVFTEVDIPGRIGKLYMTDGAYENVDQSYSVAFGNVDTPTFIRGVRKLTEWLHSSNGYARLEDSYDPIHFRKAIYVGDEEITNIFDHAGRATITFVCDPRRFLKSGEVAVSVTSSPHTFLNPGAEKAKPQIKVFGSGAGIVSINNRSVSITALEEHVIIDSELEHCYKTPAVNKNNTVVMADHIYPYFDPGKNILTFTGGITKVEVIPRWWDL